MIIDEMIEEMIEERNEKRKTIIAWVYDLVYPQVCIWMDTVHTLYESLNEVNMEEGRETIPVPEKKEYPVRTPDRKGIKTLIRELQDIKKEAHHLVRSISYGEDETPEHMDDVISEEFDPSLDAYIRILRPYLYIPVLIEDFKAMRNMFKKLIQTL